MGDKKYNENNYDATWFISYHIYIVVVISCTEI